MTVSYLHLNRMRVWCGVGGCLVKPLAGFINHFSLQTNTFQLVLVTDGRYSFILLNYGDITWPEAGNSYFQGVDVSTFLLMEIQKRFVYIHCVIIVVQTRHYCK